MSAPTPEQRALQIINQVMDEAEKMRPSKYVAWRQCDYEFLSEPIAAAIRAAEAATWQAAIDAAVKVCIVRSNQHDAKAFGYVAPAPEKTILSCYSDEAKECGRAVAALTPPGAVDAGGESGSRK